MVNDSCSSCAAKVEGFTRDVNFCAQSQLSLRRSASVMLMQIWILRSGGAPGQSSIGAVRQSGAPGAAGGSGCFAMCFFIGGLD